MAIDAIVTEYSARVAALAVEPALASQKVASITTSAAVSNAFQATTKIVRIVVTGGNAHFRFASSPTAVATDALAIDGVEVWRAVPEGESYKVAFYDGSS